MKLTIDNYFEFIKDENIQRKHLPETLKKGWDYVNQVTKKGRSLVSYNSSEIVKRTVNLYFEKLELFLVTNKQVKKTSQKLKIKTSPSGSSQKQSRKIEVKPSRPVIKPKLVEKVDLEIRIIKRFLNLHQKDKTQNHIRLFLNYLQRAIVEKQIRKTSKYADQIILIQEKLLKLIKRFEKEKIIRVIITTRIRNQLLQAMGQQVELPSVKLIKAYIGLQGKAIPVAKPKRLHNKIAKQINIGNIRKTDRYWDEVNIILKELKSFVATHPIGGELKINPKTLNGLGKIACVEPKKSKPLVSSRIPDETIMNSVDVLKLNFKKLGFKGKWLDLIGNPSKDFTAMIYGKPKMGKSYLSVDFAGYLARHHGTVLYVAREEGIDDTLQEKLKDNDVSHPDLDVSNYLPEDLSRYDFVFLDSVTKLGMSPEDLDALKRKYPDKGFIYIFQSTKEGNFRGNNEFQHDVDIVIEIPEKGRAVQFGRFNQGGELNIFSR